MALFNLRKRVRRMLISSDSFNRRVRPQETPKDGPKEMPKVGPQETPTLAPEESPEVAVEVTYKCLAHGLTFHEKKAFEAHVRDKHKPDPEEKKPWGP